MAGLSLALAIPALAACQDESGPSPSSRPSASSSASPSSNSSGKSSKPSDKPSDAGGNSNIGWAPSWEFPQSQPGWEVTVYDTDGKNKMDKSNGCVFSATQNLFDTSAKGDRTQSEHRADSILDSYKTSSHLSNVSTEPARDDSALVKDTDGNAIETRRVDMTYTGEDQKDYRLTGFVRVFTTTSTPVLLQGMYACPVDAYSSSEMEELLEATPISHPGPADMDESESGSGSGKDGRSDGKKSGSDDGKATAPSGRSDEKSSGRSSKDT
ncbi:hypothetical protein [Actinomyces sp. oral taxon 170]|uniref:hypothetical protein n=1 Tax=Actinomyces sp. oral taxon 170 TaxID=712117 RepID=UPI00209E7462|nr:hypothetical protein [Actinomyces sp. oral taxon 170]